MFCFSAWFWLTGSDAWRRHTKKRFLLTHNSRFNLVVGNHPTAVKHDQKSIKKSASESASERVKKELLASSELVTDA